MNMKIKGIEFIYLKNDSFRHFIEGERLRNDIVRVTFIDKSSEYRIYLNNKPMYVTVPFDCLMLSDISNKTWTVDTKNGVINNCIKTDTDDDYLSSLLVRYGFNKSDCKLFQNNENRIEDDLYDKRRRKFIKNNPMSNTSDPQ